MIKEVQIQAVKALNTVYLSSPSPHFPFSLVPSIHRPLFFKRLSLLTAVNMYTDLGKPLVHGSWAQVLHP